MFSHSSFFILALSGDLDTQTKYANQYETQAMGSKWRGDVPTNCGRPMRNYTKCYKTLSN